MRRRVVVTGIGMVTPCGTGVDKTWDALVNGRSGIGPITRFDASACDTRFAGQVNDFVPEDYIDRKAARRMDLYQQYAMAAAAMAMSQAGLCVPPAEAHRAAVLVGSAVGGMATAEAAVLEVQKRGPSALSPFFILQMLINMAASHISIRYGFKGPNWSTNSACSTSAHSVGEAMRLIQRDDADVAIAGGAESPISLMSIGGFNALRALSTRNDDPQRASRPFDAARDGFVIAEGAAILVLEEIGHAVARNADILAEIIGYGTSSDAFHVTSPAPEHDGAQRCMRAALADARISAEELDYVNAHATSTPVGDVMEIDALNRVLGDRAKRVPISSTKSMTGHMTGAAGAAEAAISILAMQNGIIPPTINLDTIDPRIELDCVPNVARQTNAETVMTNSFGFGGTNVSLVLRRTAN
jgi:3-oxoacyl-[acyl-carrier-protein] synthase II